MCFTDVLLIGGSYHLSPQPPKNSPQGAFWFDTFQQISLSIGMCDDRDQRSFGFSFGARS